ncbi:hypothetical protein HYY72_05590 [Candidatus Woesearchaeota archaeon]|nr:hypothetical protein [Candidatus Woesearchaeota archaeon]
MPYNSILDREVFEIAKTMPDKYPEVFLALEEYDRTRKLRKWNRKTRANFTIDENLIKALRKYCSENGLKMSSLIEKLIKAEINKRKL